MYLRTTELVIIIIDLVRASKMHNAHGGVAAVTTRLSVVETVATEIYSRVQAMAEEVKD